jgi:putative glutathione S-transferase
MIDDVWQVSEEKTRVNDKGAFVRGVTKFRKSISSDPDAEFPAEKGRYHLWVADNCPWAHRTVITRKLKKLEDIVGISVAHYHRNDQGWWYARSIDELEPRSEFPLHHLHSLTGAHYSGSATVPVLWDRKSQKIVCDESAEIIRMFNSAFSAWNAGTPDLYPTALREEIDEVNEWVYSEINNGVYRCGFARTQEAYEEAYHRLFAALDRVEDRLGQHRYLVGSQITEADVRLFTTLVRFDAVYFSHFKCNRQRISDFPNLGAYVRDLYQTPGFGETVRTDIYKLGYYGRSKRLNPSGIIPLGPRLDFESAHGRDSRAYEAA